MKYLLTTTLLLYLRHVVVESKLVEVSTTRRDFAAHRTKRNTLTLRDIGDHLGLGDDAELVHSTGAVYHSAKGVDRVRVEERYHGLLVTGTVAEVEMENGIATGQVYGHIVDIDDLKADIPDAHACQQDVDAMIDLAVVAEGLKLCDPGVEERMGERMIYAVDNTYYLVYKVEFKYFTQEIQKYPVYFIKACDKTVLFKYDKITTADISRRNRRRKDKTRVYPTARPLPQSNCTPQAVGLGGNPNIGKQVYGQTGRCLDVQKNGDFCTMENMYVKVVDNKNSLDSKKQDPVTFPCDLGYNDGINGAYGVASDALYYGTIVFRFFKELYGVDVLPHKPRMVVHFNSTWANAYWDFRDMWFGDGNERWYPLVTLDVVGHEFAHGFTSTNSHLGYYGHQSGGINEAFSDITGETIEAWVYGENDWLLGGFIGKQNQAIRYMNNPRIDGHSIDHIKYYWHGIDPHLSSGIFNRAYYELVVVHKMPIFHAFECFVEANKILWGSTTEFMEGACAVVQACYDGGFDTDKVMAAFIVTGITFERCDVTALGTTMPVNDKRDIKVSSQRRPIIELDVGGTTVSVSDPDVTLEICSKDDCNYASITQTGKGRLHVSHDCNGDVFVRVSSSSVEDTNVSLSWE